MPDTNPVIDSVALVDFIQRRAEGVAKVKVLPAGGLTLGLDGAKMSEIGLIQEAGAVFFSNGDRPVEDAGVLRRAMTYAASFDALVASRPDTPALSKGTAPACTTAARTVEGGAGIVMGACRMVHRALKPSAGQAV